MRMERRVAMKEVKLKERGVVDVLNLASQICVQRHHVGLFKKMREHLPGFFGFEAVGVLMYDFEQDQFFTDSKDNTVDEPSQDFGSTTESEDSDKTTKEVEATEIDTPSLNSKSKSQLSKKRSSLRNTEKKPKEPSINYFKKDEANLTKDQKQKKIRDQFSQKFMSFPTTSGISG